MSLFLKNKKILVTGGKGFVGSHLVNALIGDRIDKNNIRVTDNKKNDLTEFENCLRITRGVEVVFHLAADVGGIAYSKAHPATQLYKCLQMDLNLMEACRKNRVSKVVLVSCSPAYPSNAPMPLSEENLYDGFPAESAFGFGWAKRTMAVLAKAYHQEFGMDVIVVIANNTYGPRDSFDPEVSHVIPSLIRRCFTEKDLTVWGDGTPKRDFIYVKDLAAGIVLAAERLDSSEPINLGTGQEISIKELVETIARLTNFSGKISFDTSKPGGQSRRVVSIKKAQKLLGFKTDYSLEEGLRETIEWYKKGYQKLYEA